MGLTLSGFFFLCMLAGLIYAVITAVMGGVFSGADSAPDLDISTDAPGDYSSLGGEVQFSPISPTIIAVFITTFGASGLVCTEGMQLSAFPAVSISSAVGLGSSGVAYLLFRYIYQRTQGSSEAKVAKMVGLTAEVITPVEVDKAGEIAYVQMGTRYTASAKSIDGQLIGRNTVVKIVRVVGATCYVQPE